MVSDMAVLFGKVAKGLCKFKLFLAPAYLKAGPEAAGPLYQEIEELLQRVLEGQLQAGPLPRETPGPRVRVQPEPPILLHFQVSRVVLKTARHVRLRH